MAVLLLIFIGKVLAFWAQWRKLAENLYTI